MAKTKPDTIVLIHGLWLTSLSWEHWVEHYEAKGFTVIAKSWPGMEGKTVEELRADTSSIDNLGITEIVDYYAEIIEGLPTAPIIIGHSFGGAVTELLLDRGLGAAGVAMDPAPVKGVLALPASTLKSSFPVLGNPTNLHKSVPLSAEEFHYAFNNNLTEEESLPIYERYAIPGPGRPLFQAGLANFNPRAVTKVNFKNPDRPPLLILTGDIDHISPPAVAHGSEKKQKKAPSITAYKEFAGRTHWIAGEKGWEEVADFALEWALQPVAIDEPVDKATRKSDKKAAKAITKPKKSKAAKRKSKK